MYSTVQGSSVFWLQKASKSSLYAQVSAFWLRRPVLSSERISRRSSGRLPPMRDAAIGRNERKRRTVPARVRRKKVIKISIWSLVNRSLHLHTRLVRPSRVRETYMVLIKASSATHKIPNPKDTASLHHHFPAAHDRC